MPETWRGKKTTKLSRIQMTAYRVARSPPAWLYLEEAKTLPVHEP